MFIKNTFVVFIILIFLIFGLSESAFMACACSENRLLVYKKPLLRGEDVFYLQNILQDLDYYPGPVVGRYTYETKQAVTNFQKRNDLTPDGIVGPNTWALLCQQLDYNFTEKLFQLPDGEVSIVVNLYSRRLVLYVDGRALKSYPVTIGKENSKSPVGEWIIKNKYVRPDSKGPLGSRWLGLNVPWGVYGIHGTNKPWEIGRATSLGCIRLHNEYVEELFELVPVNTKVKIIGKRKSVEVKGKLRPGEANKEVMELQISLREKGYNPGRINAHYDYRTKKAVKNLEKQYGLKIDGIADNNILLILKLLTK